MGPSRYDQHAKSSSAALIVTLVPYRKIHGPVAVDFIHGTLLGIYQEAAGAVFCPATDHSHAAKSLETQLKSD